MSEDLDNTLNHRFRLLNLENSISRRLDANYSDYIVTTPEQAKQIGKKLNATMVIWGSVTRIGVLPNIMIIQLPDQKNPYNKNIAILKDSLNISLTESKKRNIQYPALTDEPTSIISYSIARSYMMEGKYAKAINYFHKAIPINKTKIKLDGKSVKDSVYFQIARCYFLLGELHKARQVITSKTNYKKHEDHLFLLYLIRNQLSLMSENGNKYLINLLKKYKITDFLLWDKFLMYYMSNSLEVESVSYQTSNEVDETIEAYVSKNKAISKEFTSYLNISKLHLSDKPFDYKLFNEEFKSSDYEKKICLLSIVCNHNIALATSLISELENEFGHKSILTLFKIFIAGKEHDQEKILNLIDSDSELLEKSVLAKFFYATAFWVSDEKIKALKYLNSLIKDNPDIAFLRKVRADLNYELGNHKQLMKDYNFYWESNKKERRDVFKALVSAFTEDDHVQVSAYLQDFTKNLDENTDYNTILQESLNGKYTNDFSKIISEKKFNIITQVMKHVNDLDITSAKNLLSDIIRNEIYSDYETGFYYYLLAFLYYLDLDFDNKVTALYTSFSFAPLKSTLELLYKAAPLSVEYDFTNTKTNLFNALVRYEQELYIGDHQKAEALFEQIINKYPNFNYLRFVNASYWRNKNTPLAMVKFKNVIKRNPNIKLANYFLARAEHRNKSYSNAIANYKKSILIDGSSTSNLGAISKCYEDIGDITNAKKYFIKYTKLYFSQPDASALEFFFKHNYR